MHLTKEALTEGFDRYLNSLLESDSINENKYDKWLDQKRAEISYDNNMNWAKKEFDRDSDPKRLRDTRNAVNRLLGKPEEPDPDEIEESYRRRRRNRR
jgi:hypothetical protein